MDDNPQQNSQLPDIGQLRIEEVVCSPQVQTAFANVLRRARGELHRNLAAHSSSPATDPER